MGESFKFAMDLFTRGNKDVRKRIRKQRIRRNVIKYDKLEDYNCSDERLAGIRSGLSMGYLQPYSDSEDSVPEKDDEEEEEGEDSEGSWETEEDEDEDEDDDDDEDGDDTDEEIETVIIESEEHATH